MYNQKAKSHVYVGSFKNDGAFQLPRTSENKRMERCWDGGKDADMWMINTICNTFIIIWFDDDCVIVSSRCHDINVVHFSPHQDPFDPFF